MRVEKFKSNENDKLSKILLKQYPNLNYSFIQKIFRKKDVKLNGKRVSKDLDICIGDEIVFYYNDENENKFYEEIYEDENILVVNKKKSIEVVSDDINNLTLVKLIKLEKSIDLFAVHRLDRNTEGIIIFAKNIESKKELELGFKNHKFEKFYLAHSYGVFEKKSDQMIAYLKKDNKKSLVYISDKKEVGYEKILTNYKVLNQLKNSAVIEVELLTGKTHQIRAHLAHIGHFIIGDEKYGDSKINKIFKRKYQDLISFRLILHFSKTSILSYLDNKVFELNKNKISFLKNL